MGEGTLVVSKAVNLHSYYKKRLEQLGFSGVQVTGVRKDGLNMMINEVKPRLLLMGSGFYQAGTPYMIGELHRLFPKLYIAAISVYEFPLSLAPWFIWHGAKSYASLWEGYEEFHRGLQAVREGREYISPMVRKVIDSYPEWPETKGKITKRMRECLIMLCCGFGLERIGEELHISRKTVYNHLGLLYRTFSASSREEMIAIAWELGLVTTEDVRFYGREYGGIRLPEIAVFPEWAVIKTGNK